MDKICSGCKEIIKTKYDTCDNCKKIYHPSCTVLKRVRNRQNELIEVCRGCIAVANTNSQKRDCTSGSSSNEHSNDTKTSSESSSASPTGGHTSPSDPLQQILEKLSTLGSLDKRIAEIQTSFDKRFSDLQSSFVTRFDEVKTTLLL